MAAIAPSACGDSSANRRMPAIRLWRRGELLQCVGARELGERCRPRRVVAERLCDAGVVAMSDDDDRLLGSAGDDRDDVPKLDDAELRDVGAPAVFFGRQPQPPDRLGVPEGGGLRFRRARHARRVVGREIRCEHGGLVAVEERIERRRRKGACWRYRKQQREQHRRDDDRRDAHEARVERLVDGAASRPPPQSSRPSGFHRCGY
jgi:hypothetical protein